MGDRNIVVDRVTFGRYRATRGAESVEWNAFEPLTQQVLSSVSPHFNRALRDLELGLACRHCGFIEVGHHIDGEERAPCNDFEPRKRGHR